MHIIVEIVDGFLQIAVQDTGIGISEEDQGKLFKLLGFLEGSEKLNKNGVGLGLVISRQITQQFEGDITVESKVGVGSTFTFKFKLYPVEEVADNIDVVIPSISDISAISVKDFAPDSKKLVFKWKPSLNATNYRQVFEQIVEDLE